MSDKGKLKFTDFSRSFFHELPYSNITVRNLLRHTSALPNYMFAMMENRIIAKLLLMKTSFLSELTAMYKKNFQLDDTGNVQKIYLIETGMKMELKRQ